MMKLIVLCSLIALCIAEAPFAGYPAAGRPEGAAFNLPNEYGAPPQQQQENPQEVEVEITQENIQYAGQLSETTTGFPNNEYLPPTTTQRDVEADVLRVQALPKIDAPSDFNVSPQNNLNTGEVQRGNFRQAPRSNFRQQPQAVRPLQFTSQFRNGRIQAQFGRQEAEVQNTYNRAPQPQNAYGAPQQDEEENDETEQTNGRLQAPLNNFRRPQFGRQEAEPHQAYGPPQQKEQGTTEVPDYSAEEEDHTETETDGSEEDDEPVIAVANAATNGQYYVLGQNNLLQKVVFMTSQTEDDRRNNGFTAQLRYSPVEPIKDPVYGYNEQGQLVRIYKKK